MSDSWNVIIAALAALIGGGGLGALYEQYRQERAKKAEWLRERKYTLYDELGRFVKRLGFVAPTNKKSLERIYDLTVSIQLLTRNRRLVKKIEELTDDISMWLHKDLLQVDREQHVAEMDELFDRANVLLKDLQQDLLG